jgi:predicted Fe-Mo cluster-binding NifX family protein
MRYAIAATGTELSSRVDERFGRAAYFVLGDTNTGNHEVLENSTNASAAHGAGTGTAQELISRKVEIVVAGKFGPKAEQVLGAAGIRLVEVTGGTVGDAVTHATGLATPSTE